MTLPSNSTPSTENSRPISVNKLKSHLVNTLCKMLEAEQISLINRRQIALQKLEDIYAKLGLQLPEETRKRLFIEIVDELVDYGPIQPLLADPQISEVMVNGAKNVYVESNGRIIKTDVTFEDNEHLMQIIERIIKPLGKRIDADHPAVDARLPDGSRVNAIIPPVAIDGPAITIRKFSKEMLTIEKLIARGSLSENLAEFLRACIISRLNIIVSGGTGSGKTTLLNALSSFIPEDERIITIEDVAELQLQQQHVVRLESKLPDPDGKGAVSIRDLVRNSLRMRPSRIIVGEVRGGEALDMLQAMNTGHDGSLTTLHANSPRDAISRLEMMSLMAGIDLPVRVIREQITSAIDLIIQLSRLRDGTREITQVTEVAGMEGDTVVLTDIFKFEQTGVSMLGKVLGELKPTGIRPLFMTRLEAAGFKLKPEVFGVGTVDLLTTRKPTHRRPGV